MTLYWTTTRTREFGVRLALGASPRSLLALALTGCMRLAAVAIVVGVAGAYALTVLIDSLFGGITANSLIYITSSLGFAGLVVFAAWLPARRAARINPTEALRAE